MVGPRSCAASPCSRHQTGRPAGRPYQTPESVAAFGLQPSPLFHREQPAIQKPNSPADYGRVIFTVFDPRSFPVVVFTYTLNTLTAPGEPSPCAVKNSRGAAGAIVPNTISIPLS